MRRLGLMRVLERVVHDDVDVLHPVSRLQIWAAKQNPQKDLEWVVKKEKGNVSCAVFADGEELVKVEASYRSKISQDEVRFRAAEEANRKVRAQNVTIDGTVQTEDRGRDVSEEVPEVDEDTSEAEVLSALDMW